MSKIYTKNEEIEMLCLKNLNQFSLIDSKLDKKLSLEFILNTLDAIEQCSTKNKQKQIVNNFFTKLYNLAKSLNTKIDEKHYIYHDYRTNNWDDLEPYYFPMYSE